MTFKNNMAEMMLLIKPGPFHVRKFRDPEQLYQDFTKYAANFEEFLTVAGAKGNHKATHENCDGCKKAKATLRLVRGDEMKSLFDHVGGVTDANSFEVALTKVLDGIRQQTNQAKTRFRLFQQTLQGGQCFAEWFVKMKKQAKRYAWAGCDAKAAARDAILYQRDDKNLMKMIIIRF